MIKHHANIKDLLSNASTYLSEEWDYAFNYPITPFNVTIKDSKNRGWICKKCGNKWEATTRRRQSGISKCLKCRSIGISNPELLKEWDYEFNYPTTPFDVTSGSHKKVAWICSACNYKWISIIKNRCVGNGCPNCKKKLLSSKRSTPNDNSLSLMNKKISLQWHPTKNGELSPKDVCCHSNKRVWWECSLCNHEWQSIINIRHRAKYQSCPKDPRLIQKEKSISFLEPEISSEFYRCRNPHVNINNISTGSRYIVEWKCNRCGYLWEATPHRRVRGGNCPNCCDKLILRGGHLCASFIEAYYYLFYKSKKIKFYHNKKYGGLGKIGNCRYDFYIPSEKTYVEVTSFQKNFKKWFSYLRRIVQKKRYVENILGEKFLFIKENVTAKQRKYVNSKRQKIN